MNMQRYRNIVTAIFTSAVLAVLLTAFSAFMKGFPLSFVEPVVCIQMVGAYCPPFTINIAPFIVDSLVWFAGIVLVGMIYKKWKGLRIKKN